jgi:hypothetical protein
MRRQWLGVVLFGTCSIVAAQQAPPGLPTPRLIQVYPIGVSTLPPPQIHVLGMNLTMATVVKVTGTDLDEPQGLLFSHPGLKAEYLDSAAADIKLKGKAKQNATAHTFRVTAAPDVPPGIYDVRVVGQWGVSNPRAFAVGRLPEVEEREPNNDVAEAHRLPLDTTVNGVFAAGTDVDYFAVTARKGQRVVLACLSSSMDSRAVPLLEVFSAGGQRLAGNRNYKDNDAVADFIAPTDGDYYVRLSQFTYLSGGADHFYRLTITTAPWIDAVVPPAVEFGKPTTVTLYGRNLPNGQPADGYAIDGRPLEKLQVTIQPPTDPAARFRWNYPGRIPPPMALMEGFGYTFQGPNGVSFPVPIILTDVPVVARNPALGAAPDKAQPVPAPGEIGGFIAQRGEVVWHRFEAKKGQQFVIELFADRLGTPGDFYFSVRDGKDPNRDLSGEQDDDNDTLHPTNFFTRTLDPPPFRFTAPEDGAYYVQVGCRQAGLVYGPRMLYRLRIAPPQPDFRVIAMPYSRHYQVGSAAWQGGQQAYDVYVDRRDGYSGDITITAEGLPPGVTALPLTLGAQSRWGVLVLKIAPDAPPFTGYIRLKATGTPAQWQGPPLVREVRSAAIIWGFNQQTNTPVLARLDHGLPLAIRPFKAHFALKPDWTKVKINDKPEPANGVIRVKPNDKFVLPLRVEWISGDKQNLTLAAERIMPGNQEPIIVQFASQPTKDKPEAVVNATVRANIPPGSYPLIIKGTAQLPFTHPVTKKGGNVPVDVLSEPALVVVLPTSLAKVAVTGPPNNQIKPGTSADLVVRVERLYNYQGPFQLAAELPPNTSSLSVQGGTIPPGQNEGQVRLTAAPDAKAGPVNGIIIVVNAPYDAKYTVRHEAKINVNIVKK